MHPSVSAFFDPATNTVSYIVADDKECAIVDPVLDFDAASGRTSTNSVNRILDEVARLERRVAWILETHIHADHLSAAPYLREKTGAKVAIGRAVTQVQQTFGPIFNAGPEFATDGSQFNRLLDDGERFNIGEIEAQAISTPGHTPACMTYVIGDAAFVGDTLFMPDFGTARTDFPGGDAATLYHSIQRIFALPPSTRLFMCHDYKAPGRDEYRWETTVAEERANNIHVGDGVSESDFVELRNARDAGLSMPKLIVPSVQVNMRAGALPPADENGTHYLKVPLNVL